MDINFLHLTRMGIDTHQEPVVYMRDDCHVCRAEGFNAHWAGWKFNAASAASLPP
jgi:hypothetical protein